MNVPSVPRAGGSAYHPAKEARVFSLFGGLWPGAVGWGGGQVSRTHLDADFLGSF